MMKETVNCKINCFTKLLSSYTYLDCKLHLAPSWRTIMIKKNVCMCINYVHAVTQVTKKTQIEKLTHLT